MDLNSRSRPDPPLTPRRSGRAPRPVIPEPGLALERQRSAAATSTDRDTSSARTSRGGGSGRGRGKARGRGRGRAGKTVRGAGGDGGESAADEAEARRLELLARLNQIERQRREITRSNGGVVSFAAVSVPVRGEAAEDGLAGADRPGVLSDHVPAKRARTSLPNDPTATSGKGGTGGTRRRSDGFQDTKRPRGGSFLDMADETTGALPPAHSPNLSARGQTSGKPPPTPVLHLESDTGVAPLGLGTGHRSARAASRQSSPGGTRSALNRFTMPASPTHSGRTSRVRTPSVLLANQPGEGPPAHPGLGKGKAKNNQISFCLRIVKDLLRLKDSHAFSKPIDQLWPRDQLPGYFEMITEPMDLKTIQGKLEAGEYLTNSDEAGGEVATTAPVSQFNSLRFAKDMRLVFNNARTYNRPGDMFYEAAGRLMEKFDAKFATLPVFRDTVGDGSGKKKKRTDANSGIATRTVPANSRKDAKRRKASARRTADGLGSSPNAKAIKRRPKAGPSAVRNGDSEISASPKDLSKMSRAEMEQRLDALKYQIAIVEARSPSPSPTGSSLPSYMIQAQALYNVPMVFDEKMKLTQDVGKLSGDKLQKIIALVSKHRSNTLEVNNDEEIELDMDSLGNKTLRDMQAFVNQTLYRGRKRNGLGPPGSEELTHFSRDQLRKEIEKVSGLLGAKSGSRGGESAGGGKGGSDVGLKKQKSFYDDSSSSSGSSSSGSSSDSDSSSGSDDSDDSGDDSGDDKVTRRERNLEHMRKMGQVVPGSGTPLASPSYSGVPSSMQAAGHFSPRPSPSPPGLPRSGGAQKDTSSGARSPSP